MKATDTKTEDTPLFVKCQVCDHYVHPDSIQKFAATGEFVCDGCEDEYIEREGLIVINNDEESYNPKF